MGDAFLLVGILLALVALASIMVWDLELVFRGLRWRERRAAVVAGRRERLLEDIAWSQREREFQHATELFLCRVNVVTIDQLVERLLDRQSEASA